MIEKQFQLAKQLIEIEVAETNDRYANDPCGQCYLLDVTITDTDIDIIPQTDLCLHGVENFFHIADATNMNIYITTRLNREQNIAPCIRMF